MRLAFILNNLPRPKPVPPRHGVRPAGYPQVGHAVYAMIAADRRRRLRDHRQLLEQVIARQAAFEERLAEARRQQSLLKTSLYATILSES